MAEAAPIRLSRNGPVVRLLLFTITLIAFILSCHAAASCDFLVAQHEFFGDLVTGLYRTNGGVSTRTCTSVDYLRDVQTNENGFTFDLPDAFKAARAFAIMAPAVGSLAVVLFILCLVTERFNNKIWFKFVVPGLLIAAAVLQVLTFSAFGIDQCSDYELNGRNYVGKCIFADGANAALAATVLYLLPTIPMMCCIPTPPHPVLILYKDASSSTGGSTTAASRVQEQVALNSPRPLEHQQESDAQMYIEDDAGEEQPIEVQHGKDP